MVVLFVLYHQAPIVGFYLSQTRKTQAALVRDYSLFLRLDYVFLCACFLATHQQECLFFCCVLFAKNSVVFATWDYG